jgi:hypothetical protein
MDHNKKNYKSIKIHNFIDLYEPQEQSDKRLN